MSNHVKRLFGRDWSYNSDTGEMYVDRARNGTFVKCDTLDKYGYPIVYIDRTAYSTRRIACAIMTSRWYSDPNWVALSLNDNRAEMEWGKLVVATLAQKNGHRKKSTSRKYTSAYKGVSFDTRRKKYVAQVCGAYIKSVTDENCAAQLYNLEAARYFGKFSRQNRIVGK